jgi:hypothetical protein
VTHPPRGIRLLVNLGAFLLGQKLADKRALARYLVERGVILILLELPSCVWRGRSTPISRITTS